jgi:hypothetical protein
MHTRSGLIRIWLVVISLAAPFAACTEGFPNCPTPGGVTNNKCYYKLTITKIGPEAGTAMGTTARSVVEKNRKRRADLFSLEMISDFKIEEYPFFEYHFHIQDQETLSQLKVGSDIDLQNVPGTIYLIKAKA